MSLQDITIGALIAVAPIFALAMWVARLWLRNELDTILEKRENKIMEAIDKRIKQTMKEIQLMIEVASLKEKGNPNNSGTWPPQTQP